MVGKESQKPNPPGWNADPADSSGAAKDGLTAIGILHPHGYLSKTNLRDTVAGPTSRRAK